MPKMRARRGFPRKIRVSVKVESGALAYNR